MTSILDHVGNTPLVPLERVGAGSRVPVLAKCEFLNPGGSLKDRIALSIIDDAERRGALRPGMTIVEATGGNTGVGLALVAAIKGYRLVCVLPEKMSMDKRRALKTLGAEVMITKDCAITEPEHFRNVADRLAKERGWFLTDQFRNPANVRVHEEVTAVELIEQAGTGIGAFVAGIGTGGCITGVARRFRREGMRAQIVLADPIGSTLAGRVNDGAPSKDDKYDLEGIGGGTVPEIVDLSLIDRAERVSDADSFAMTHRLIREEGLLCGGSSGAAVVAALRTAERPDVTGPVVVILADSWDRYWAKDWMK